MTMMPYRGMQLQAGAKPQALEVMTECSRKGEILSPDRLTSGPTTLIDGRIYCFVPDSDCLSLRGFGSDTLNSTGTTRLKLKRNFLKRPKT